MNPAWRGRATIALLLGALLPAAAGCAPHLAIYPRVEALAASGQYAQAAQFVESKKEEYSERNAVLFYMDRGTLLHYAGDYEASNRAFEEAERRIDELYTESISGHVGAFIVNDNTLPYRGEDFESVVINIYRALNYAQLGSVQDALVEARKVDQKLDFINRQYDADKKNVYKEDAFARLLMGIFYEMNNTRQDLNDAYISNRLAWSIYRQSFAPTYGTSAPELLGANLLTTAALMGPDELTQARAQGAAQPLVPYADKRAQGQVVFVHFAGRSPVKVESSITAYMPDGNLFRIAFPAYRARGYLIAGAQIRVDGSLAARLEEGQPTGAIAIKNLEDRKGRIAAKAIARATTKYLANLALQRQARERGGEGAGLLAYLAGNVFTVATEQADLRAWQTLPDRILVGRVLLTPGPHELTVEFTTSGGGVVSTRVLGTLHAAPGSTRFVILHSNT
ncbi:MAG: hypothetical protein HY342_04740 [Candidatus Lambdaproteobacteria bacterium]|nr:hypothetical protein [Candidatus Lambdaproteobacteria bacterium]